MIHDVGGFHMMFVGLKWCWGFNMEFVGFLWCWGGGFTWC